VFDFSLTFSPPPLSYSFVSDFLHTTQHTHNTHNTTGKAPSHPDYSPKELINFLKELTKSTEGGTPITNDEVGEKEEKELVNSKQNNTFYDRPDTPGETATGGREEAQ
jgi:hypothetical protein